MQEDKRYWLLCLSILIFLTGQSVPAPAGSLSLDAECVFPLLEEQPLNLELRSGFPVSVPAGTALPPAAIKGFARINHELAQALALGGAQRVRGRIRVRAGLSGPRGSMNLVLPLELRSRALPEPTGAFTVSVAAQLPPLTFTHDQAGYLSLRVRELAITLVPVRNNGDAASPGPFRAKCGLPRHQQRVLHRFVVNGSGGDAEPGRIRIRREPAPDSTDEAAPGAGKAAVLVPAAIGANGVGLNGLPVSWPHFSTVRSRR